MRPTEFTDESDEILEGTSRVYTATILDESDIGVDLARILDLKLTYYDKATGTAINSRNDQNVKNLNNVTIATTGGGLQWEIQPEDTAVMNASKSREIHRALFEYTYDTTKKGKHEVDFVIRNLNKVP